MGREITFWTCLEEEREGGHLLDMLVLEARHPLVADDERAAHAPPITCDGHRLHLRVHGHKLPDVARSP